MFFRNIFNNPAKAAAVLFVAVLAFRTFVSPGDTAPVIDDMDLHGIATQAAEPAPHIVNIDEEN